VLLYTREPFGTASVYEDEATASMTYESTIVKKGKSLNLNLKSIKRIDITNIKKGEEFLISVWIYPKNAFASSDTYAFMRLYNKTKDSTNGVMDFQLQNTTNSEFKVSTNVYGTDRKTMSTTISKGEWSHLCFYYDKKNLWVYINGIKDKNNYNANVPSDLIVETMYLEIGGKDDDTNMSKGYRQGFDGYMDNLIIAGNISPTDQEIYELYTFTK
jgi:hypothetical protein